MAGKADVDTHLADRHGPLADSFARWADPNLDDLQRADVVVDYFVDADLGDVRRVGSGSSVLVKSPTSDPNRPTILVIGRHSLDHLTAATGPRSVADASAVRGGGAGSTLAPTVAFAEGYMAAKKLLRQDPATMSFLSIGANDRFQDIAPSLFTGNVDGVFVTDAVVWNPSHPTITTGARGQVVAELSLTSNAAPDDFTTAGAFRNPLSKLTEILGSLRDDHGRISLPGFYDRAHAPDAASRSDLGADGHDANAWAADIGASRPSPALSALERASLWPVVSVLALSASPADAVATPSQAQATVAFYLVPDQRHAEVATMIQEWFAHQAPRDLQPTVRIVSSTRPYHSPVDSLPVAAQARAAYRVHGRKPVLVPAGGPVGAGEIAFSTGAPVAFAGLCDPAHGFGSTTQALPRKLFDTGVALAAETCLQLRRS